VLKSLLVIIGVLSTTMSLALCADAFAGERERNTLELLYYLPVDPSAIFWGKILGIVPLPIFLGWTSQVGLAWLASSFGSLNLETEELLICFLLTPLSVLFLNSLCTLISLGAKTVRGAAQASGIVALFYLFAIQIIAPWLLIGGWMTGLILLFFGLGCVLILYRGKRKFEQGKL